jgi:TPR repeat protein
LNTNYTASNYPRYIEKLTSYEGLEQRSQDIDDSSQHETNSEMITLTKEKSEQGSAQHMARLGRWYLFGEEDGIDCDTKRGIELCQAADLLGDCNAKALLGLCLLQGYGVEKDREEGFAQLVEAACDGSTFAAYKLGSFYFSGTHSFKEDRGNALKWLTRADGNKHLLTCAELSNLQKYLTLLLRSSDLKSESEQGTTVSQSTIDIMSEVDTVNSTAATTSLTS